MTLIFLKDFILLIQQLGLGSVGESIVRGVFKKIDKNQNGTLEWNEALGAVQIIKNMFGKKNSNSQNENE